MEVRCLPVCPVGLGPVRQVGDDAAGHHEVARQLIPIADLKRIATAASHAIVLIDEAYIEFGGETFLPHLTRYPNVLVGRTFSKAYGLAGMRVGVLRTAAWQPLQPLQPEEVTGKTQTTETALIP